MLYHWVEEMLNLFSCLHNYLKELHALCPCYMQSVQSMHNMHYLESMHYMESMHYVESMHYTESMHYMHYMHMGSMHCVLVVAGSAVVSVSLAPVTAAAGVIVDIVCRGSC